VEGSTTGTGNTVLTYSPFGVLGHSSDVAYSFTLTKPSAITLSTCGSSYDTWLHLYTADGEMLGEQIASCDDCGSCYDVDYHTVLSSAAGTLDPLLPAGALYQRNY